MLSLGQRIRKCREGKKLSQKTLASFLNIQYQSVQDWEKDRTKPSTGKIEKLCKIFDVTATWILLGKDSENCTANEESKKYLAIYQQLKPETKEIVLKVMEALLLKDNLTATKNYSNNLD